MTPFRKLTSAETAALEALGNSAEDWSKVLVSEDFKPFQLLQSHLEGNVEIAAEARIIRSRVANYRIGSGSLVEGVTALECRRRSAFGNGVGVATMNECGGRTVKIFDRLSAQVAYIMAVYRHRPQTIAALEKMIDAYAGERSSAIGEVGKQLPYRRGALRPRGPHRQRCRNRRRLDPRKRNALRRRTRRRGRKGLRPDRRRRVGHRQRIDRRTLLRRRKLPSGQRDSRPQNRCSSPTRTAKTARPPRSSQAPTPSRTTNRRC